jgi:hypothetical protein
MPWHVPSNFLDLNFLIAELRPAVASPVAAIEVSLLRFGVRRTVNPGAFLGHKLQNHVTPPGHRVSRWPKIHGGYRSYRRHGGGATTFKSALKKCEARAVKQLYIESVYTHSIRRQYHARAPAAVRDLSMPHAATTKGCLILCTVLGLTSNLSATPRMVSPAFSAARIRSSSWGAMRAGQAFCRRPWPS